MVAGTLRVYYLFSYCLPRAYRHEVIVGLRVMVLHLQVIGYRVACNVFRVSLFYEVRVRCDELLKPFKG